MNKKFYSAAVCTLLSLAITAGAGATGISVEKTITRPELSADNKRTEVTLSIPGDDYVDRVDILFVIDTSNLTTDLTNAASDLMQNIIDSGLSANVGVIKFKGRAVDNIKVVSSNAYQGLTSLTSETKSTIMSAVSSTPSSSLIGSGTNIHGALCKAEEWLDADTTVPDYNKYVLLYTDGRSYIWNDENGNPTSIYQQYTKSSVSKSTVVSVPEVSSQAQRSKYSSSVTSGILKAGSTLQAEFDQKLVRFVKDGSTANPLEADFNKLFNVAEGTQAWTDLHTDTYDNYCYYVDGSGSSAPATVAEHLISKHSDYIHPSADAFQYYFDVIPNAGSQVTHWLDLNPLEVSDDGNGNYYFTGNWNDDSYWFHVSGQEKSLYLSAHLWADLGAKYHTVAVDNKRALQAGYEITYDFMNSWLPDNSELSATVSDSESVKTLFNNLENNILHIVGRAFVTDNIWSGLDIVDDAYGTGLPFRMLVGDTEQTVTQLSASEWAFGTANGGVYPYVAQITDPHQILWNINVPVEAANPIKLKYVLEWNDTGTEDVYTDVHSNTTIQYWSSDNNTQTPTGTQAYNTPQVIYRDTAAPAEWLSFLVYNFKTEDVAGYRKILLISGTDTDADDYGFTYTVSGNNPIIDMQAENVEDLEEYKAYSPSGDKVRVTAEDTNKSAMFGCPIYISDADFADPQTVITFRPYVIKDNTTTEGNTYSWSAAANVLTLVP